MALDHARDFVVGRGDPMNMASTTPLLYVTRWITHLCAPTFVFLAGTAAYLKARRSPVVSFLLTRGLWLIFLELVVIRVTWPQGPLSDRPWLLLVIWTLGVSMIFLGGLIAARVPIGGMVAIGAVMVLFHNLFDMQQHGPLWTVLHEPGHFELAGQEFFVQYPLVPWLGVIALGYAFGAVCDRPRVVLRLGIACLVAFAIVRTINVYGDTLPWSVQPRGPLYTVFSFFNLRKYPPSLDYLLSLGIAFVLLAFFERVPIASLAVFGRTPLFFYLLHLYLLLVVHLLYPAAMALPWAYPVWIATCVALYPLCWWFDRLKQRRRDLWWLSYL
jgi:uncharacterized membrane protein